MAGIYVHIPYCRQKCNYCNFFSVVSRKSAPEMIRAICTEIGLRVSSESKVPIDTVYLGGGTPSLLSVELVDELFKAIHEHFEVNPKGEVTIEANPDDITPANLEAWKRLGVNRLSIGIQSFREEDLKYLNRAHTAQKALECILMAREFGFPDLTIDLIYGIPTLTDDQWISNLQQFTELKLPHLSAYALTVEPRTPLYHQIETGKVKPVDEKQSSAQFLLLMDYMQKNGYLHYEISNFCLPGHYAKHNISYWNGTEYYGFGPSAHSFNGMTRQWNVSSISEYLESIRQGNVPGEKEVLTRENRYNEYVMTGLRTMWGCKADEIRVQFGSNFENYFIAGAEKWISQGLMENNNGNYTLTTNGKLLADGIASDLFQL